MTTMIRKIDRAMEPQSLSSTARRRAARRHRRVTAPILLLISLLPFVFLWWIFVNNYHYLILPLPWRLSNWLYIHADVVAVAYFLFICHWLCRRPSRRYYRDSVLWWLVYCAIPAGSFMLLVFAQRRPVIAVVILWGVLKAYYELRSNAEASDPEDRRAAAKKAARAHRILAGAFLVVMLIPACLCVFRYHMLSKTAEFQQLYTEAFQDVALERIEAVNDKSEIYAKYKDLFNAIREWEHHSEKKREDTMTKLFKLECELNRIPFELSEIKFSATEEGLMGYYDHNEKTLCVSLCAMNCYSPRLAMITVLHEWQHYRQFFLCEYIEQTVGWDSPLATDEYRLWEANENCYLPAEEVGMDAYEAQPLEASARLFAEEEYDRLMELLETDFQN